MLVAAGFAVLVWVLNEHLALFDYNEPTRGIWKLGAVDWVKFVAVVGAVGASSARFITARSKLRFCAVIIAALLGLFVLWLGALRAVLDYEKRQPPEYRTF